MIAQWLAFSLIKGILNIATGGIGDLGGIAAKAIGAKRGGDFIGTPNGVMKMASGGSFTVPQGFSPDKYPLLLDSGEKVSVTPAGQVSGSDRKLDALITAVNNLSENMVAGGGQTVIAQILVDGEDMAEKVFEIENKYKRNDYNKEDF